MILRALFRSLPSPRQRNRTSQKGQKGAGLHQGDSPAAGKRSGSPKTTTPSPPPPGASSPSPSAGPVPGEDMKEEEVKEEEEEGDRPEKEETKEEEKMEVDFVKTEMKKEAKKEAKVEGAQSSSSSGSSSTSLSNKGAKEERKSSSGQKRPTSEDGHGVDREGKRPRMDGVELEAQLELKITAKAGSHHKLEKIVQELVEKRLRGLQLTAFDLSLKDLKDRVEKYDKHQSAINTLQAQISRLVKKIGDANQSSEHNRKQEISSTPSREEEDEATRLWNSNAVLSAASGDQWRQLINDYFLPPRPEEARAEGNERDSDVTSGGTSRRPTEPQFSENAGGCHDDGSHDDAEREPLFITDPTAERLRSVRHEYASVVAAAGDDEDSKVREFKCSCQRNRGNACSTLFTPEEMAKKREQVQEMTTGEKHMFLLGKISSTMNLAKERRTLYFMDGLQICRETFKFLHVISQDNLTAILKLYKQRGVSPPNANPGGAAGGSVLYEDVARIARFLSNLADDCALPLAGRLPGLEGADVRGLPVSETEASVWRKYEASARESGHKVVGLSAFQEIWTKLLPNVVIGNPPTDLCSPCRWNNAAIQRSANLPERAKAARLRVQEEHLRRVMEEQEAYLEMTDSCRAALGGLSATLGPNPPCSRDVTVHYSFDFAQQIHYPSDPLRPGPLHFTVPRKCGVFGVCCEGLPQQVSYLVDEAHRGGGEGQGEGSSDAVLSYLHHFFAHYGLGERHLQLHCRDSALFGPGRNQNLLLWYCAWRCAAGLHDTVSLSVLAAGHGAGTAAIGPDWCFGLLKQALRRTPVSCLDDVCRAARESAASTAIVPQPVGTESGERLVPAYDWRAFLAPGYRALPGLRRFRHLRFTSERPGVVLAKESRDSPEEEEEEFLLLRPGGDVGREGPGCRQTGAPGLDAARQWYLYDEVRDFCTEETKDVTCPKPSVPRPSV